MEEADRIIREFGSEPGLEAIRLRKSLCWLFEFMAISLDGGSVIGREWFHRSCESLLFEQGEAAFNRALTPVLEAMLALSPGNADGRISRVQFVRWMTAFGMNVAAGLRACDKAAQRNSEELSLQQMLLVMHHYHLAGPGARPPG